MIVFTNGCFDLIHPGHIDLLDRAKGLGSKLVVGINSDRSVRSIKGPDRPFQSEEDRKAVLLGLKAVDEVIIFDELTPEKLIQRIKPDILVKGGDWNESEIIGADFVKATGGQVFSLPLKDDFSSTKIVDRVRGAERQTSKSGNSIIADSLQQHVDVFNAIISEQQEAIRESSDIIWETISTGGKILICGNGGSAADAQHIAAEFVGRYETERKALPALALTTDTSALTALANDYSFERIFARQVEALASQGDCLVAISTSGNSPNIIAAVMAARNRGCRIIGMTGARGKKLASLCDSVIMVPSVRTARVQEGHITIAHILCEIVDAKLNQD